MRAFRFSLGLGLMLALCACGDSGALANREPPDAQSDTSGVDRTTPGSPDMGTPAPIPGRDLDQPPSGRSLVGVWAFTGTRSAGSSTVESLPSGTLRYKYVVAQRFVTVTVHAGRVVRAIEGTVQIAPDRYTEHVENVMLTDDRELLDHWIDYRWTMRADRLTLERVEDDQTIQSREQQLWRRLE